MPFGLHWPEIVLILVIILVVFGVGKLPQVGGAIGKSIKEFRKARTEEDQDAQKTKEKDIVKKSDTEGDDTA